eukprot:6194159-Pleurochrysis_carterae.AAC.1
MDLPKHKRFVFVEALHTCSTYNSQYVPTTTVHTKPSLQGQNFPFLRKKQPRPCAKCKLDLLCVNHL